MQLQLAAKTLRQVEMDCSSITAISGFYCIIKGNSLVAIDRSTAEISNIPFNPVQWSDSIFQLGTKFIRPENSIIISHAKVR